MTIHPFEPAKTPTGVYPPASLDIETAPDGRVLDIGFAYWTGKSIEYEVFAGWSDFLTRFKGLSRNKRQKKFIESIYAHNGGGFDWLSLIEYANQQKLVDKLTIIPSGSSAIGIDISIGAVCYHLRDSMKLFAGTSLKNVAASFGVESQKEDVPDYYKSRMDEYKRDHPNEYYSYLRADVFALQQCLEKFWRLIIDVGCDIGTLPLTLPAAALKLWRFTLSKPITTPSDPELKLFERRAYSGGRTECFEVATSRTNIFDANSLYPSVMVGNEFPDSDLGYWCTEYSGEFGLYEIEYHQPRGKYHALLKDEETNEFRYNGRGVYTHAEIEKLIELGGTFTLFRGYVFISHSSIFERFVSTWYNKRLEAKEKGDEALQYICKILLNSLYGKTAQREESTTIELMDFAEIEERTLKGEEISMIGDFALAKTEKEVPHAFASIASYVTAYARLALYEQMCRVVDEGYKLLYVDTDSVHVAGDYTMPTGVNLGEWKNEKSCIGAYIGKKTYALLDGEREIIKAKGIGSMNRSALHFDDFTKIVNGEIESLEVSFSTFPSLKEVIKGDRKSAVAFKRTRTIRSTYKKYLDTTFQYAIITTRNNTN